MFIINFPRYLLISFHNIKVSTSVVSVACLWFFMINLVNYTVFRFFMINLVSFGLENVIMVPMFSFIHFLALFWM